MEAYFRTPDIVSSKPYVARALNLVRNALTVAASLAASCSQEGPASKSARASSVEVEGQEVEF